MIKKGMAVPLVLIFATIMGVVSLYLLKTTKNVNTQIHTSYDQIQSYFIARAGIEHAMLKIKYLNRELYDAVCMSQGRNPLFNYSLLKNSTDFSNPWSKISVYNPGPIFLYADGEVSATRTGVFTNLPKPKPGEKNVYYQWLDVFKEDLTSVYSANPDNTNKFLDLTDESYMSDMTALPSNVKDLLKSTIGESQYTLTDLSLPASIVEKNSSGGVDNHMVVQFTIESVYNSKKYNSSYNYKITRTAKISRE